MGKVLFPDYFPFCLKDNYDDIPFYIKQRYFSGGANSFNALMAAYWRVRFWRVNYYGFNDEGEAVGGVGSYGFDIKTEEQLVCPNPFIEFSFVPSGQLVSWPEHQFSIFWNNNFSPINFDPFEYAANKLNQFAFNLLYQPGDDLSSGAEIFSSLSASSALLNVPIADAGILVFPYVFEVLNYTAYITIAPHEYWSYDGTYNTSTGLPLNA